MIFAQIKDGMVQNTFLLDDLDLLPLFSSNNVYGYPYDYVLQIDVMYPRPGIGWTFDGIEFSSPDGTMEESLGGLVTLLFSKSSSLVTPGTYLDSGTVAGSSAGQSVLGHTEIVGISATNVTSALLLPMVFQVQKRTGVNSFADISGATISIPVSSYSNSLTFYTPITINPTDELSVYVKSGTPNNPVIQVRLG